MIQNEQKDKPMKNRITRFDLFSGSGAKRIFKRQRSVCIDCHSPSPKTMFTSFIDTEHVHSIESVWNTTKRQFLHHDQLGKFLQFNCRNHSSMDYFQLYIFDLFKIDRGALNTKHNTQSIFSSYSITTVGSMHCILRSLDFFQFNPWITSDFGILINDKDSLIETSDEFPCSLGFSWGYTAQMLFNTLRTRWRDQWNCRISFDIRLIERIFSSLKYSHLLQKYC